MLLNARRETIAVPESSAGGLLSAALQLLHRRLSD